jgi:uncharacterized protein
VDAATALLLAAAGLLAGFLSTLYGIGGGIVMVPVLHYAFGVPFPDATAVSLLVIALQSPFGVRQHLRRRAVVWPLAWPLCLSGAAGVVAGILAQPHVPERALKGLLAGLMALAALRMVRRDLTPRGDPPGLPTLLALGGFAGAASKLLGVGGGLVTVPALTLLGVPVHKAVGSSLVPVFTNALLASLVALLAGFPEAWTAVPLAAGAFVAVPLGARVAHALPDAGLRQVFAAGLVAAAGYVAWTAAVPG